MFTSKVYSFSTASSYASLTLGVMQSTAGVTVSLAAMLAFKLWPTLSPCAPKFHRTPAPICSQRHSRCSSVDTVASNASVFTIDSLSTLVELDIKCKHRLPAASIRKPFIETAPTTQEEIRPLWRTMSESFTAVAAPFTTSSKSLFSPASASYLLRVAPTSLKAAVKKAGLKSAGMVPFGGKTAVSSCSGDDVAVPSPLFRKSCSLVPEECDSLDEETIASFAEGPPLKKRKAFRPAKMGGKISRACVKVLL